MNVNAIRTDKIRVGSHSIYDVLDQSLPKLTERAILVITSKIISICEGRVVKIGSVNKADLVKQESDYYIQPETHPLGIALTITKNLLVPTAGIDESNGDGYYVLWPEDAHKSARTIRTYLAKKFALADVGVLITDSRTTPMRWGTTGIALSYAGFFGLNDFIGSPDVFGKPMQVTKVNVADGLAESAVICMGESNEQTPLACITSADFVRFDKDQPTKKELKEWQIPLETDLYGPLLKNAPWKKGRAI